MQTYAIEHPERGVYKQADGIVWTSLGGEWARKDAQKQAKALGKNGGWKARPLTEAERLQYAITNGRDIR